VEPVQFAASKVQLAVRRILLDLRADGFDLTMQVTVRTRLLCPG
jgi:hypothetical protein